MKYLFYDWLGSNAYLFAIFNSGLNNLLPWYFWETISALFQEFVFLIYYTAFIFHKIYQFKQSSFNYENYVKSFNEISKIGMIYAFIIILYTILKYTINFPRPYCSLNSFISMHNFSHERCLSSFPSAHTAISILICYCFYSNKLIQTLWPIIILLASASRVALAMHYPADIIFSLLISSVICVSVSRIYLQKQFNIKIILPLAKLFWDKLITKFL